MTIATITLAQKIVYLHGYEQAIQTGECRSYLPASGLHSSQIIAWHRLLDAETLDGNNPASRSDSTGTRRAS